MFKEYFSSQFLFQINRIQVQPIDKFFLAVGVFALVLAVILKLSARYSPGPVDTKYRNRLSGVFFFLGLTELVWYGFRIQFVRFFGTHFLALLLILVFVVWLLAIVWKMFKNYKGEKSSWEKEQVRLKYLPK
jgi:hypothetical protein